jgi:hypothetical protein
MNEQEIEIYWTNKHPMANIVYGGRQIPKRDARIPVDVRKFIWNNDCMLLDVIKKENLIKLSYDETALACQQYIVKNYKYISDVDNIGYVEFWMLPFETLCLKSGDCEDGAVLEASLMISAGIPQWRVRCNAGFVIDSQGDNQGHAYVTYCREKINDKDDNNWVILDWCFLEDSNVPIGEKPLAKNNDKYCDLWFSFNAIHSWSHKQYDVFENINDEPKTLFNGI